MDRSPVGGTPKWSLGSGRSSHRKFRGLGAPMNRLGVRETLKDNSGAEGPYMGAGA